MTEPNHLPVEELGEIPGNFLPETKVAEAIDDLVEMIQSTKPTLKAQREHQDLVDQLIVAELGKEGVGGVEANDELVRILRTRAAEDLYGECPERALALKGGERFTKQVRETRKARITDLPAMSAQEVIKRLKRAGLELKDNQGTKHTRLHNPDTGKTVGIRRTHKEFGPALVKEILETAGISLDEFLHAA
jgi:predicted RNA binding protein YcfA (HicA-like mRNA interferase family)